MGREIEMFWKKAGLLSIILAALAIVGYAQTSVKQRAHSANAQAPMTPGYLGVGVQDLTDEKAKALNLKDNSGVEISAVTDGAPAAKAGVRVGDVILEVNGQKVTGREQFAELIAANAPGTKIALAVARISGKLSIAATVETRPPGFTPGIVPQSIVPLSQEDLQMMMAAQAAVASSGAQPIGFVGESLGSQLAAFFGVQEGVLVQAVGERTPADRAGLKAGDVIVKVNGMPVATPREISGAVRQSSRKTVVFTVVRNKKEITLSLEMACDFGRPPLAQDL